MKTYGKITDERSKAYGKYVEIVRTVKWSSLVKFPGSEKEYAFNKRQVHEVSEAEFKSSTANKNNP